MMSSIGLIGSVRSRQPRRPVNDYTGSESGTFVPPFGAHRISRV